MKSIREELTARLLGGTLLLLLVATLILGALSHVRLVREFDFALKAKADALAMVTSLEGQALDIDFDQNYMPEFFQFFLADGTVVAKSPSLGDGSLPLDREAVDSVCFFNLSLADRRRGRAVQFVFSPREEDEDEVDEDAPGEEVEEGEIRFEIPAAVDLEDLSVIVVVARRRERLDALLIALYATLVAVDVFLLVGIGLVACRSIRRGLAPVETINEQIDAIEPGALSNRIKLPEPPAELQTILNALNGLLNRLQDGFERERRFSSNVAHELRTPVAELRSLCEVGGRWPDDTESVRGYFKDIHEIALQMERVVTSLLSLTRCDNGTAKATCERIRLEPLVQECWTRSAAEAEQRKMCLELSVDPKARVQSDRQKLEMIVQNLVENAIVHGAAGSVVRCTTSRRGPAVDLVIENRAHDIESGDLPHIFERFWQKDSARSNGTHSGLGMAIVGALCELLKIGLAVDLKNGSVFEARLSFFGDGEGNGSVGKEKPRL